jgi:hypothetical protein
MFAAWLSYITSLFLPTATVMSESVVGWAAALFSIQAIIGFYKSVFLGRFLFFTKRIFIPGETVLLS